MFLVVSKHEERKLPTYCKLQFVIRRGCRLTPLDNIDRIVVIVVSLGIKPNV